MKGPTDKEIFNHMMPDDEKAFDKYWDSLENSADGVVTFQEALKLSFIAGLNYSWEI